MITPAKRKYEEAKRRADKAVRGTMRGHQRALKRAMTELLRAQMKERVA